LFSTKVCREKPFKKFINVYQAGSPFLGNRMQFFYICLIMLRDIKTYILLSVLLLCSCPAAKAQGDLTEVLKQDRYLVAGNLHPYIAPARIIDSAAPKGFVPFYISFYGRHGSRYLTGSPDFIEYYALKLDKLHEEGALSENGESLRRFIRWSYEKHKYSCEDLTDLGFQEARNLGGRFADRYSQVFRQARRDSIRFRSSPVLRSAVTGMGFSLELQKKFPQLEMDARAGQKYYFTEWNPNPELARIQKELPDSMLRADFDSSSFCRRMFSDSIKAAEVFKEKGIAIAFWEMTHILSISHCIDADADPFSCFTDEELAVYAKVQNARSVALFIHSKETGDYRDRDAGAPLLRNIIEWADAAIEGNGICADLRFGHDSGVGPLMSLLHAKGYDKWSSMADSYKYWPAWEHLYMACNVAFVFYRNKQGEVLVKLLENERETTIPALSPYSGPYYKWADFRDYCLKCIRRI